MKKQIVANLSNTTINLSTILAKNLSLSRNSVIESILMLEMLNNKHTKLNRLDIDTLLDDYSTKSTNTITTQFKELNKKLCFDAKIEILWILYQLNLNNKIRFSTDKHASVFKNEEYLLYYCIIDFREEDLDQCIDRRELKVEILGIKNKPINEYIFIAKELHLKHSNSKYQSIYFNNICTNLGLPLCDIIKVHYTELRHLAKVVDEL